jgi:hypothetical protein
MQEFWLKSLIVVSFRLNNEREKRREERKRERQSERVREDTIVRVITRSLSLSFSRARAHTHTKHSHTLAFSHTDHTKLQFTEGLKGIQASDAEEQQERRASSFPLLKKEKKKKTLRPRLQHEALRGSLNSLVNQSIATCQ